MLMLQIAILGEATKLASSPPVCEFMCGFLDMRGTDWPAPTCVNILAKPAATPPNMSVGEVAVSTL